MDHVKTLLGKVLHKRGLKQEADAAHITYLASGWLQAHLGHVASSLRVRTFRDGVLLITAENSIALQECSDARIGLLEAIQKDCASSGLREVRVMRAF